MCATVVRSAGLFSPNAIAPIKVENESSKSTVRVIFTFNENPDSESRRKSHFHGCARELQDLTSIRFSGGYKLSTGPTLSAYRKRFAPSISAPAGWKLSTTA